MILWYLDWYPKNFIKECVYENVTCKVRVILRLPQSVDNGSFILELNPGSDD